MLTDPQHLKQLEKKVKVRKKMVNVITMMVLGVLSVVVLHMQVQALSQRKKLCKPQVANSKSFVLSIYIAYAFSFVSIPQNEQCYQKLYSFLRLPKSKIKVQAGWVPSEGYEEDSVPCISLSFQWFSGNLQHSLAYGSYHLNLCLGLHMAFSLWVYMCPSFSLRTPTILDQGPALEYQSTLV